MDVVTIVVIVCSRDNAEAVCAEANKGVATGMPVLDEWTGVSVFPNGFGRQVHEPVVERGWIEYAPAASAGAKSCTDFYDYSWTKWKFTRDLVVAAGPR